MWSALSSLSKNPLASRSRRACGMVAMGPPVSGPIRYGAMHLSCYVLSAAVRMVVVQSMLAGPARRAMEASVVRTVLQDNREAESRKVEMVMKSSSMLACFDGCLVATSALHVRMAGRRLHFETLDWRRRCTNSLRVRMIRRGSRQGVKARWDQVERRFYYGGRCARP